MMRRIAVVPYDPHWADAFAAEAGAVAAALGDNLLEIHHIGSTAIPGIHAKPVIDMLAVVSEIDSVDRDAARMAALGYEAMGEFGIAGRRYFRRDNAAGQRTHQVHAFEHGSPDVARHMAFRDFMRAHPVLAAQYGELKQRLAEVFSNDAEAYMDGKDSFIQEMQTRALAWEGRRGAAALRPRLGQDRLCKDA
jgi:GrpB-like predicted nucleotidyltransferase (UPF0157 family)